MSEDLKPATISNSLALRQLGLISDAWGEHRSSAVKRVIDRQYQEMVTSGMIVLDPATGYKTALKPLDGVPEEPEEDSGGDDPKEVPAQDASDSDEEPEDTNRLSDGHGPNCPDPSEEVADPPTAEDDSGAEREDKESKQ